MSEVASSSRPKPTGRELYEACLSGVRDRPFIPRLRSDTLPYRPIHHSLVEFREQEGKENRERRLHELWRRLPNTNFQGSEAAATLGTSFGEPLTPEKAENMRRVYEDELLRRCGGHNLQSKADPHTLAGVPGLRGSKGGWSVMVEIRFPWLSHTHEFLSELWYIFYNDLDLDGNGHLDLQDLRLALKNAGIILSPTALAEFITFLTQSPHSYVINFRQFRDSLLLLPRDATTSEIYRYYEVKRLMGIDGRGSARVTMEGDVSLSAEDSPASMASLRNPEPPPTPVKHEGVLEDEPEEQHDWLQGHTTLKFLLAGGIAGAVSRSCTAPFDRLKIFLMTRTPEMGGAPVGPKPSVSGIKAIGGAVARIYAEGGVLAFWTGNGLSVMKILPESAIKFMTYETAKRAFAKYWDHVEDSREISGTSRFLSGGIGGISSQLSLGFISPQYLLLLTSWKTQMMSITGQKRSLVGAARNVWRMGGIRAFYRGLTCQSSPSTLYAAIDMSTFEALKLTYTPSIESDEPGALALLAFGGVSGSVGAISVYPLNLVRTRLQASGSPGHPQRYTGVWDVAQKTYQRDGWRGFYRGLLPTLAKVVPSVSITYLVYEHSKRRLGV
ncbi:mitochondrial carrier [Chiua virens]|nr:mitochondrial carrier [Chiua virens]